MSSVNNELFFSTLNFMPFIFLSCYLATDRNTSMTESNSDKGHLVFFPNSGENFQSFTIKHDICCMF